MTFLIVEKITNTPVLSYGFAVFATLFLISFILKKKRQKLDAPFWIFLIVGSIGFLFGSYLIYSVQTASVEKAAEVKGMAAVIGVLGIIFGLLFLLFAFWEWKKYKKEVKKQS